MKKFFGILFLGLTLVLSLVNFTEAAKFGDDYRLEKVLIFSRHDIRAPYYEQAKKFTPHEFVKWTSNQRELSLRGGLVETELGQYFRKYLVAENFMPENYQPAETEFRFYANSRQRTVATAHYFATGFLPFAEIKVERKFSEDKNDPVFIPKLTFVNEKFRNLAEHQVLEHLGVKNWKELDKKFAPELSLIEKILDLKNSPYAKETGNTKFVSGDVKLLLEVGQEPAVRNFADGVSSARDTLVMQYYESPSDSAAAFGNKITAKQWATIGAFQDTFLEIMNTPAISVAVANPLLRVMHDELTLDTRRLTFLCGHDTNIASITGALGVEKYSLPDTLEPQTPIGSKIVIEKRRGRDGKNYASLYMIYPGTEQIRNINTLTLENPPKIFPLKLVEMQANEDGLYLFDDVMKRFEDAIAEYDELKNGK